MTFQECELKICTISPLENAGRWEIIQSLSEKRKIFALGIKVSLSFYRIDIIM